MHRNYSILATHGIDPEAQGSHEQIWTRPIGVSWYSATNSSSVGLNPHANDGNKKNKHTVRCGRVRVENN